jgi:hypothetical protein
LKVESDMLALVLKAYVRVALGCRKRWSTGSLSTLRGSALLFWKTSCVKKETEDHLKRITDKLDEFMSGDTNEESIDGDKNE